MNSMLILKFYCGTYIYIRTNIRLVEVNLIYLLIYK